MGRRLSLVTPFLILEKVLQRATQVTASHQKKKKKGTSSIEVRHVSCRILLQDEPCTIVAVHLDHRSECRRLQEWEALLLAISITDGTSHHNPQGLPQMILVDFNALTRSDHSQQEWREIVRIREFNSWEAPTSDLTGRVQALGYQDVRRAADTILNLVPSPQVDLVRALITFFSVLESQHRHQHWMESSRVCASYGHESFRL